MRRHGAPTCLGYVAVRIDVETQALERVPSDIRAQGGVARMSDPKMIKEIIDAVTIPVRYLSFVTTFTEQQHEQVMAKCRIGHFVEAQVLQAIGVDFVDESEVLTPADPAHHVRRCMTFRRRLLA